MKRTHWITGLVLALAGLAASGLDHPRTEPAPIHYEQPPRLSGTVLDMATHQTLFQYQRAATATETNVEVQTTYTDPQGQIAAREHILYQGKDLVSYELEELQSHTQGGVTLQRDPGNPGRIRLLFRYGGDNAKAKTRVEWVKEEPLINDMVGNFLARHWDTLMSGGEVACRYLAIARKETVGFKFQKTGETTLAGQSVVVIKMVPSSFIISALIQPLTFLVEKDGEHRVMQYTGRTVPKTRQGGGWKDLDARTTFAWPNHP